VESALASGCGGGEVEGNAIFSGIVRLSPVDVH
jgi:hypothetical protein